MKLLRIIAVIVASIWFVPVSCTGTWAVATSIKSNLDTRWVERGDTLHREFLVAVEPGANGQAFEVVRLTELDRLGPSQQPRSFLLSRAEGKVREGEYTTFSFSVVETGDGAQVVEVREYNDDWSSWSRYRATATGIEPIASRMMHIGHIFGAFPYALGFSVALYAVGRLLLRRRRRSAGVPAGTE